MSDPTQMAIVAGIVAFVVGFPTWLGQLLAARNAAREASKRTIEATKAEETAKKVDAVIVKADEIHTLTDGNLSRTTNALEVSTTLNKTLQGVIDGMIETKRQDDAAKATAAIVAKIPEPLRETKTPETLPPS